MEMDTTSSVFSRITAFFVSTGLWLLIVPVFSSVVGGMTLILFGKTVMGLIGFGLGLTYFFIFSSFIVRVLSNNLIYPMDPVTDIKKIWRKE